MKQVSYTRFSIAEHISIDSKSPVTKYQQIVNQITDLIKKGILYKGQKLPPLNKAYKDLNVSRDVLIKAYKELQNRNLIKSIHGKGFYISKVPAKSKKKVFLLFDVMNGYKEVLYRSIVENLGSGFSVDIYFHYYNINQLGKLIDENVDAYDYMVVMPHFNEDVSSVVARIPISKRFIIDKDIPALSNTPGVYQDFENDVYNSLTQGLSLIRKYKMIYFIDNQRFQFIPAGIIGGFKKFCKENRLNYTFIEDLELHAVARGELYLLFNDRDLISVIKSITAQNLKLGTDVGIVSYDDTPLKEVLKGGITVISTDFYQMGALTADLIKGNRKSKIANRFSLIRRNSL